MIHQLRLTRRFAWRRSVRKGLRVGLMLAGFGLVAVGRVAMAGKGGGGGGGGAPEIDPGSAFSALTLLAGGLLLVSDRIRGKRPRV